MNHLEDSHGYEVMGWFEHSEQAGESFHEVHEHHISIRPQKKPSLTMSCFFDIRGQHLLKQLMPQLRKGDQSGYKKVRLPNNIFQYLLFQLYFIVKLPKLCNFVVYFLLCMLPHHYEVH